MTPDEFRSIALSLKGATESSHMHHPDFRAHGRIFATLGYPDTSWGMIKLSSQDQKQFVELHPQAFSLAKGAWGLQGSTMVRLDAVKPDVIAEALGLAWQLSAATVPAKRTKKIARRSSI
jgi:hypothetical protein